MARTRTGRAQGSGEPRRAPAAAPRGGAGGGMARGGSGVDGRSRGGAQGRAGAVRPADLRLREPRGGGRGRPGGSRPGGAGRGGRRGPFVFLVVLLLAAGLIGLLTLNTALNQDSFQLSRLQRQTTTLTDQKQELQQQIDGWSAPGALAARAQQLGMVPGGVPAFLRDNGTVLGSPEALPGTPPPTSTPTPRPLPTGLTAGPVTAVGTPSPTASPSPSAAATATASASPSTEPATGGD